MADFKPASNIAIATIAGTAAAVVVGLMTDNHINVSQTTSDGIMVLMTAGVAYLHDLISSMKNAPK